MANKYSVSELIKTAYSLLMTKVFEPNMRLVRRPVYIRGRKSLRGGKGLTTGRFCRFDLEGTRQTLFIGDDCQFGDMTHIVAYDSVSIGNNVLAASKCFISDTSHGSYSGDEQDTPVSLPIQRKLVTKQVSIGNNVWIGENVVILGGTSIGDGCIIGANSILSNKDIPKYSIVVGNGVIIKTFDEKSGKWIRK